MHQGNKALTTLNLWGPYQISDGFNSEDKVVDLLGVIY